MSVHFEGKLVASQYLDDGRWGIVGVVTPSDCPIIVVVSDKHREGDIRRLVASWNLLTNFTTEQIESGAADLLKLDRERNDLIEALRWLMSEHPVGSRPLGQEGSIVRHWQERALEAEENARRVLAKYPKVPA